MKEVDIYKGFTLLYFTLIEPGPVIMVSTSYGGKDNLMTISWHMVMDFTPRFALLTGPWNYSYYALTRNQECVISIPTIELMEKVINVGTTSGAETDKFDKFGFTKLEATEVKPPLVAECYANIECLVDDYIEDHNIFVLKGVKAWVDEKKKIKPIFHYRGDGTFVADGELFHHKKLMRSKLAPGI